MGVIARAKEVRVKWRGLVPKLKIDLAPLSLSGPEARGEREYIGDSSAIKIRIH